MLRVCVLVCVAVVCGCGLVGADDLPQSEVEAARPQFEQFKAQFERSYPDQTEEDKRLKVFAANLRDINRRNAERTHDDDAVFGVTEFSDMTSDEFVSSRAGLSQDLPQANKCGRKTDKDVAGGNTPNKCDWRDEGAVSPVKNQGNCESCWAFSTTGNLEGQYYIKHKKMVQFSEQMIMDCTNGTSNSCHRGLMTEAMENIMKLGGEMTEADYPYEAKDHTRCNFDKKKVKVQIDSCNSYRLSTEKKMAELLHKNGPLCAALDCTDLQHYKGGVLSKCSKNINHGVLLVGYDIGSGSNSYWILKNTWGKNWGEKGFFRLKYNNNTCGIRNTYIATAKIK